MISQGDGDVPSRNHPNGGVAAGVAATRVPHQGVDPGEGRTGGLRRPERAPGQKPRASVPPTTGSTSLLPFRCTVISLPTAAASRAGRFDDGLAL